MCVQSAAHRDDSVAPACQSQHLLEEHLRCATDWREKDDGTPDALWAGIIQRPHLTVIIINNNLVEAKTHLTLYGTLSWFTLEKTSSCPQVLTLSKLLFILLHLLRDLSHQSDLHSLFYGVFIASIVHLVRCVYTKLSYKKVFFYCKRCLFVSFVKQLMSCY